MSFSFPTPRTLRNLKTKSRRLLYRSARSGSQNSILIRGDQTLIARHGRLLAARKLGMDSVPVIRCDDLTEAQARLLTFVDNKICEPGGWNTETLKAELDDLKELEEVSDLTLSGFHENEIDTLLADLEEEEEESESDTPKRSGFTVEDLFVPMTAKEIVAFKDRFADYADANDGPAGFMSHLLFS